MRLTVPEALLALLAWSSWGALWLGGAAFLVVEVFALFAHYLANQRGFSIGLWRWLMVAMGALITGVAAWNRDLTREYLLHARRSALSVEASLALLFTIALLAAALRRRRSRHPLVVSGSAALVLLVSLWSVWVASPLLPDAAPAVEPPRFTASQRLLLVSIEGADLPWLLPAMERGDMPFLRSLHDTGAWGQLRTVSPFNRAAAVATMDTGCSPAVHGVSGRRAYRLPWLSPDPVSLLLDGPWPTPHQLPWRAWQQAATPPPRRATLWEILERSGLKVGLAGWPGLTRATWSVPRPLAAEAIPYGSLDEMLRASIEPSLEIHPEIAPATRFAFSINVQTPAAAALRNAVTPVEGLLVDTDLPARLRPLWTFDDDTGQGDEVLRTAARIIDEQLRELWSLMGGDNTLLVVVSPYGMAPPSPWQRIQHLFAHNVRWRVSPKDSPDGFVLFSGPGVRPGARLRGCRLPDVTATILYLLQLPVARDMAGRVRLEAITDERIAQAPLRLIPSYPAPAHTGH